MKRKLYVSFLRKDIGWFDRKENAPSNLTASLAADV
jgi:hypothetical protein